MNQSAKPCNDMEKDIWKSKLTAFDAQLCNMVESLTEKECEPKDGGDHYVIEPDYGKHNDPQFICALWDAIEGRAGKRLVDITDDADRTCLVVKIKFYSEPCTDAAFIPKIEQE